MWNKNKVKGVNNSREALLKIGGEKCLEFASTIEQKKLTTLKEAEW